MISWTFTRTAALFFIFLATGCQAQAVDCEDRENEAGGDPSMCVANEYYEKYVEADKKLNEIYRELKEAAVSYDEAVGVEGGFLNLLPGLTDALRDTQRAWIMFRDKECYLGHFFTNYWQVRSEKINKCLYEKTLQRTEELKVLF